MLSVDLLDNPGGEKTVRVPHGQHDSWAGSEPGSSTQLVKPKAPVRSFILYLFYFIFIYLLLLLLILTQGVCLLIFRERGKQREREREREREIDVRETSI